MEDSYRHKGLRKRLVESLREKGIRSDEVLNALYAVPRHWFLDKAFEEHAYEDKAFPIGNEQTISQPFTVAYQSSLLEVRPGDRILEIGTGSGYQAAILSVLGARVYTIERQEALYESASKLLKEMNLPRIRCFFGDGTRGLKDFAPYDKILVTAGAPVVPEELKKQLVLGGMLVVPVGEDVQTMYRIRRVSEMEFEETVFDTFRFVPFLEGVRKK